MDMTAVPTNTLIWNNGPTELRESDASGPIGDPIPMTFTQVTTGEGCIYQVGRPQQELRPHTSYMVTGALEFGFTTGDGPDQAPPPVPEITGGDGVRLPSGPCGTPGGIQAGANVDFTGSGAVFVVNAEETPGLDTSTITGSITTATGLRRVMVGTGDCGGNKNLSGAMNVRVQVGAFSAAGVFSGWSTPHTVWLPPVGYACACTQTGAPPIAGAALFLAWAVVVVGRRRNITAG